MVKKIIVSSILLQQLNAMPYQDNYQIGANYNIKDATVTTSQIKKIIVQNILEEEVKQNIVQIKNLNHLLQELAIENNYNIFQSKKIDKLLNNPNINNYTLTYLIHTKITNFRKILKKSKHKKHHIKTIDIGGEYIALIHIKTESVNDYKLTKKQIDKNILNWKNIDKFYKKIEKISQTHHITYKTILDDKQSNIIPLNLKELIQNAKNFSLLIQGKEIPHTITISPKIKQYKSVKIYISLKYSYNNLLYIRKNSKQFNAIFNYRKFNKLKDCLTRQKRVYTSLNLKELNSCQKYINYPNRHRSYIDTTPINLPIQNLRSVIKEQKYTKISDDIKFSLKYRFNLIHKNNGKVIVLNWEKVLKENEIIIHKSRNSKIILDSFVNYRNLIASSIQKNTYGSLTYNTTFDKYQKQQIIQGKGIINNADCGYNILDDNGTFDIGCNNIKFNDIEIEFEHKD